MRQWISPDYMCDKYLRHLDCLKILKLTCSDRSIDKEITTTQKLNVLLEQIERIHHKRIKKKLSKTFLQNGLALDRSESL